jgi:hypothetical protein
MSRGSIAVPSQVRVVWAIHEPDVDNLHIHMTPKLSLLLACLIRDSLHALAAQSPLALLWDTRLSSRKTPGNAQGQPLLQWGGPKSRQVVNLLRVILRLVEAQEAGARWLGGWQL